MHISNLKLKFSISKVNLQVYQNFRVKLVFECDFEISWSLGPWDPWTLGFLDLFPPPILPSSYFLLPPPISLEIEIEYWRLIFDLYIDVEKLSVGGGVP